MDADLKKIAMKHCLYNYIYSIHLQKGFFVRVYEYTKALKFEKML